MDELAFLVDLHRDGKHRGAGGGDETRPAITLSGLSGRKGLKIAYRAYDLRYLWGISGV